jgi:hypothetical protein
MARLSFLLLLVALLLTPACGQFKHRVGNGKGPRAREPDFDAWASSHGACWACCARGRRSALHSHISSKIASALVFASPRRIVPSAGHAFSPEERKLRHAHFASARATIDAHNARW